MARGTLPETRPRRPFQDRSGFDWIWFLFKIRGRIGRRDLWLRFVLPCWLIQMLLLSIDGLAGGLDPESPIDSLFQIFSFLTVWPGIAVAIKRLHDRDRSAWFLLVIFIPVVGAIWLLIEQGFLPGTPGPNRFGPPPVASPPGGHGAPGG
ncbi:MAG: DUF805 domain-containing protein [Alphaproteobacteria bacterium]